MGSRSLLFWHYMTCTLSLHLFCQRPQCFTTACSCLRTDQFCLHKSPSTPTPACCSGPKGSMSVFAPSHQLCSRLIHEPISTERQRQKMCWLGWSVKALPPAQPGSPHTCQQSQNFSFPKSTLKYVLKPYYLSSLYHAPSITEKSPNNLQARKLLH